MIDVSKANYGQEMGLNLKKVVKTLLRNQDLCKLLINTDLDPTNPKLHPDLEDTSEVYRNNIRVIPLVTTEDQTSTSKLVIIFQSGTVPTNYDTEKLSMLIFIYCPFVEWEITGDRLRPFAIMSEVRRSLQDKKINGLGEITYNGFSIHSLTDQMASYVMEFNINAFK